MKLICAIVKRILAAAACGLSICAPSQPVKASGLPTPSRQDLQILGRVLSFREDQSSGSVLVAIVYNSADAQSIAEAQAFAELMGSGVAVGNLVLQPVLLEQGRLGGASGYAAIFTAASVSTAIVQSVVRQRQVPCITRQIEQVTRGGCIVSIRSSPSVAIAYSSANAAAAGVRFATAFIMMVREV